MYLMRANKKSSSATSGFIAAVLSVSCATVLSTFPVAAQQTARASVGCPKPGDIPLDWSAQRLKEACPGTTTVTGAAPSANTDVTVLNCENLKTVAAAAPRASVGTGSSDVQVAAQTYQTSCVDSKPPPVTVTQTTAPKVPDGIYSFSRGYSQPPAGSKGTCDQYTGSAVVSGRRIEFESSGYRWAGAVTNDGYVEIRNAGIQPIGNQKPLRNPTSILGPVGNANLYNGYCGSGYFVLSRR